MANQNDIIERIIKVSHVLRDAGYRVIESTEQKLVLRRDNDVVEIREDGTSTLTRADAAGIEESDFAYLADLTQRALPQWA